MSVRSTARHFQATNSIFFFQVIYLSAFSSSHKRSWVRAENQKIYLLTYQTLSILQWVIFVHTINPGHIVIN